MGRIEQRIEANHPIPDYQGWEFPDDPDSHLHRARVGVEKFWDEMGEVQLDFLTSAGLGRT